MARTSWVRWSSAIALSVALAALAAPARAQVPPPAPPAAPASDECPCTALVNRMAAIEEEARLLRPQVSELEREMGLLEREMREMREGLEDAAGAGLSLGGGVRSESELAKFPPYQALAERLAAARERWSPLLRRQTALFSEFFDVARRLRECLARCGILQPQVRVAVGGPNNPFNPRDPVGGGSPGGGTTIFPAGGTFLFARSTYEGSEGGAVQIGVVRSAGGDGRNSRGAVSVLVTTVAGSASPGADFTPVSQTLTWADGDTALKALSIALVDDTLQEGPESFAVVLSNVTGDARIDIGVASVTIVDNDGPPPSQGTTLQFSQSAYEVAEGAGSVTITVTRSGSAGFAEVRTFTGPGSATGGADYQPVNNGILTWNDGDATPRTFTVPIVEDALVEGPENFFVTLNNPVGTGRLGAPATASITILDNDQPPPAGPCGQQGNAWQPNTGAAYACSGNCNPNAASPVVSVAGDLVTVTNFHAGGAAAFQGCTGSLASQSGTLTYFGQAIHRATIVRSSNNAFSASIVASTGAMCGFSCTRSGP